MSKHSRKVRRRLCGGETINVHTAEVAVFGWRVLQLLRAAETGEECTAITLRDRALGFAVDVKTAAVELGLVEG